MARNKRPRRGPKAKARAKARPKARNKSKAKAQARKRSIARRRPASRKTAKRAKPAKRSGKAVKGKALRRKAKAVPRRRPVAARAKSRPARPQRRTSQPARRRAKPAAKARPKAAPTPRPHTLGRPPLDRERRVLSDDERLELAAASSSSLQPRGPEDRLTSSAHAGHDELRTELRLHTETSPVLTAGDVDAKWQDAYAVGDEAPGGDNPTPDQDRVDDIGKALGIVYEDGQELQGGDEVRERDRHRWEFDPASSEDWSGERKK